MKSLPVFPVDANIAGNLTIFEMRGMTLRDYFAAKAMNGLISDGAVPELSGELIAEMSYAMADAMLKAREE
jgi:hypothetical protein